jgi:hypothetical protein
MFNSLIGWNLTSNQIKIGLGKKYNKNWKTGQVFLIDTKKNSILSQTVYLKHG